MALDKSTCFIVFATIFFIYFYAPVKGQEVGLIVGLGPRTNSEVSVLNRTIEQVKNIPIRRKPIPFRDACKATNKCPTKMNRLMRPQIATLENAIIALMIEMSKLKPGARLPVPGTQIEPAYIMLDGYYKEPPCEEEEEECTKRYRSKLRALKKIMNKRYNDYRASLVGYGGRNIWGGEGNLFYKK